MANSSTGIFIAFFDQTMIMGGGHSQGHSWCWCQPKPVEHRGHMDYEHRGFDH